MKSFSPYSGIDALVSLESCSEVEVEMFSGSDNVMMKIGQQLAEKYGLASEKRSKFYRGLLLLGLR